MCPLSGDTPLYLGWVLLLFSVEDRMLLAGEWESFTISPIIITIDGEACWVNGQRHAPYQICVVKMFLILRPPSISTEIIPNHETGLFYLDAFLRGIS